MPSLGRICVRLETVLAQVFLLILCFFPVN